MDEPYRIRRAVSADVPALAEIERACFTDPWSPAGLDETIQYETAISLVAELGADVVGYVMARISGEEGEILNLAVLSTHRRRGIGRELLARGLAAMAEAGAREAYLEVRESNSAAIGMYGAQGFRPVGLRSHYYRSPLEDALVLRAALTPVRE